MIDQPRIGATAPDIELPDTDGVMWRLGDQRGHTVVVIFHRHIH